MKDKACLAEFITRRIGGNNVNMRKSWIIDQMMKPNVMNDKGILTEYLSVWIERSTRFKLKSLELELNDESIWRDES